jgi:hypothetical protein
MPRCSRYRTKTGRITRPRAECSSPLKAGVSAETASASGKDGGCCTNPRRGRWIVSKGGFRIRPPHQSREVPPRRGRHSQPRWGPSSRSPTSFSETALCNSHHDTQSSASAPSTRPRSRDWITLVRARSGHHPSADRDSSVAEGVARPLGANVIAWRGAIAPGSIGRGSAFTLFAWQLQTALPGVRGSGSRPDRGPDRAMRVSDIAAADG